MNIEIFDFLRVIVSDIVKASDVYDMLLRIPAGRVTTYGDIAKALGHPTASRAIGRILNKNPNPIIVPCHRVIKSDGNLGGYAFGTERKKELLTKEGLPCVGTSINEFAKYRVSIKELY